MVYKFLGNKVHMFPGCMYTHNLEDLLCVPCTTG